MGQYFNISVNYHLASDAIVQRLYQQGRKFHHMTLSYSPFTIDQIMEPPLPFNQKSTVRGMKLIRRYAVRLYCCSYMSRLYWNPICDYVAIGCPIICCLHTYLTFKISTLDLFVLT
jgi:hypothetical protein